METANRVLLALTEEQRNGIGWTGTFICVAISIWIALTYLRHTPKLFTVMSLFACSWMLVLGRYSAPKDQLWHLTTDVAGFLDVYIGGLLYLEASGTKGARTVTWLQVSALWLLFFIAAPKAIALPGPIPALTGFPGLDIRQTSLLVSLAMTLAGFASIALGAFRIAGLRSFVALVLVLAFYGGVTAMRTNSVFFDASQDEPMPVLFVIAFAVAKLLYTALFCFIVVSHANSALTPLSDKRAG